MIKEERQKLLKKLITDHEITTQEELLNKLKILGVNTTQATLSRDIRELKIIKEPGKNNSAYKIMTSSITDLKRVFIKLVVRADKSESILVLHTHTGEADLLAGVLDTVGDDRFLGTVNGIDTVIAVCRSKEAATEILDEINDVL